MAPLGIMINKCNEEKGYSPRFGSGGGARNKLHKSAHPTEGEEIDGFILNSHEIKCSTDL